MNLEVLVELSSPALLDTVSRPQDLLHLGRTLECHRVVQGAPLSTGDPTVRAELPQLDVVNEGDVIRGVPVLGEVRSALLELLSLLTRL